MVDNWERVETGTPDLQRLQAARAVATEHLLDVLLEAQSIRLPLVQRRSV